MLFHVCNQNPFTLIFRYYYYSVEELGGREGGGGGGRTKPRPKPVEKPSAARFAHPLRGAEVLVAVRGPSPGEGGGKNCKPKLGAGLQTYVMHSCGYVTFHFSALSLSRTRGS